VRLSPREHTISVSAVNHLPHLRDFSEESHPPFGQIALARIRPMANKVRSHYEPPQKTGREGWLYSEQHKKLCHFKPSMTTVHAQRVEDYSFS